MDMSIEVLNQLAELSPSFLETFSVVDFSRGTSSTHEENVIPTTNADIDPLGGSKLEGMNEGNEVLVGHTTLTPYISPDVFHGSKDRQVMETSNINPKNISSAASENGVRVENDAARKKSLGKRKKGVENTGKEVEKTEEAIRVRARKGQASCSHSLAERVRREKINDRLRRLQDLVPGCYKAMGLVEVLDQIINYVHSLQSQVEFLSMELAAASSFCDFNLDSYAMNRNAAAPSRTTFKAHSLTFKPAF